MVEVKWCRTFLSFASIATLRQIVVEGATVIIEQVLARSVGSLWLEGDQFKELCCYALLYPLAPTTSRTREVN
jgi:hypothetical protein